MYFVQKHRAGELCESDFTHMTELGITIGCEPFAHMVYHFVLTCSKWETGTICASESFASLSEGLQNALWGWAGCRWCGTITSKGEGSRRGRPNENGDVEQRHYRLYRATDQALLLRGRREFRAVEEYRAFLGKLFEQLNSGRRARLAEEMERLRPLPDRRLDTAK